MNENYDDDLTQHLDLAAILTHYGWVVPEGRHGWFNTRCYEHDDAHASAVINLQEQAVKCMACDFKGNAITVVKIKEGLSFKDAYARAAELSGRSDLSLPSTSPRGRSGLHAGARDKRGNVPYVPPRLRGSGSRSPRG